MVALPSFDLWLDLCFGPLAKGDRIGAQRVFGVEGFAISTSLRFQH
jgi:hypothetical protein